jgi:hypothetical protein
MWPRNYSKLVAEALERQKTREAASKEPYDQYQRVEAVCQLVEQRLGKRPKQLREEVLRVLR